MINILLNVMGILERIFRLALLNILREFDSTKYRKYSKKKNYRNTDDFNYYYNKYREYYKKYYGNRYDKYDYNGNNKRYTGMSEKRKKIAQYYANLEAPLGASLEEVKASWKKLLKKYHPDIHQDEIKKKKATILTQKLNEAYFEIEKYLKENR